VKYFVTINGREIVVEVDGDRVTADGRPLHAHLSPIPGTPLRHLLLDTRSLTVVLEGRERGEWQVGLGGASYSARVVDERTRHIQSLTAGVASQSGPAVLKAPMPGLVVRVLVAPGEQVAAGQGLVVLEAMKMENELRAPAGAMVRSVSAAPGQAVEKGQVLVEFWAGAPLT
jgi:pyruvate carboxylase subunit B